MLSFIQRYALLMSGVAVMALASPLAFAATTGGFDTPTGVQTMPIAVEGNAILTLTDNPSNAVAVDGKLQLSGWLGIGTTTPVSPLDIVIPYYPSTPAIHTYAPSVFGNIWIGGANDFAFDGGSDSYFWFTNTGAASGATAFLWNGQFNLYIANTGNVGIGTTAPQAALDVNGLIYIGANGTITEGSACSPNGLVGRDSKGALFDCQSGTWGRPQTFTRVWTTIAEVNGYCIIGDPTNPPNYNQLQYNTTCASRYCDRTLNYGFGLLTEDGPGYNTPQPFSSNPNTSISIACSR